MSSEQVAKEFMRGHSGLGQPSRLPAVVTAGDTKPNSYEYLREGPSPAPCERDVPPPSARMGDRCRPLDGLGTGATLFPSKPGLDPVVNVMLFVRSRFKAGREPLFCLSRILARESLAESPNGLSSWELIDLSGTDTASIGESLGSKMSGGDMLGPSDSALLSKVRSFVCRRLPSWSGG